MSKPTPHDSVSHALDLWNPVVQLPYLGAPIAEFLALAEADGWYVDHMDDSPPDLTNLRSGIRTLEVRSNELPVRSRGGRVVGIGRGAYAAR